jgi:hypothetical protein
MAFDLYAKLFIEFALNSSVGMLAEIYLAAREFPITR